MDIVRYAICCCIASVTLLLSHPIHALDPDQDWLDCQTQLSETHKSPPECEDVLKQFARQQQAWLHQSKAPAIVQISGTITDIIVDEPIGIMDGLLTLQTRIQVAGYWIILDFAKQQDPNTGQIKENSHVKAMRGDYPSNLTVGDPVIIRAFHEQHNTYTVLHQDNITQPGSYFVRHAP